MPATQPKTPDASLQKRAVRALERRFGQSIMPCAFRPTDYRITAYGDTWRCTDIESGSWIEFYQCAGRLIVHRDHDGADQSADVLAA